MLKYPFLDNKSRYFYFSKEVFLAKKICVQKIFAGLAGLCIKKALNWCKNSLHMRLEIRFLPLCMAGIFSIGMYFA